MLYAVYPPTQYLAVKVRAFIDFLVGRFSGIPPWSESLGRITAQLAFTLGAPLKFAH